MEENIQNQPTQPENKMQTVRHFLSQKKVSIVVGIIIVVIIVVILALFAVFSNSKKAVNTYQFHPLPGSILFQPATISVIPGQATSATIMINTGGNPIEGAEIAVQYNPKLISNVTLSPFKDTHSALSYALEQVGPNQVYNNGVVMTLKLPENVPPQPGTGQIAILHFMVNKVNVAINSTTIKLIPITNFFAKQGNPQISTSKNELQVNFAQQATPQTSPQISTSPAR